ncbi:hypothetical protein LOAG_05694 [Loa loa]|uniref:Uncharacterized protein n=1 Tax=Loa loa TaxID=7209 RepID=A0A1S0TZM7_LOALO|nr:hypothetical protein LOAG_05694 [Loa loa]EFO22791.1 hypothetical protein LOAG_05694 [Loa loa]
MEIDDWSRNDFKEMTRIEIILNRVRGWEAEEVDRIVNDDIIAHLASGWNFGNNSILTEANHCSKDSHMGEKLSHTSKINKFCRENLNQSFASIKYFAPKCAY